MTIALPITTIELSPGSHVLISGITWEQYEALLEERGGDRQSPAKRRLPGIDNQPHFSRFARN